MTHSSGQSTVVKPSESKTCSTCPHFHNYKESNGRGWCDLFNHQARQQHEQTNDCVLSESLENEQEISNDNDAETTITDSTSTVRTIDVTNCIPDITENIIHDSEHSLLPSDIFEGVTLQAINDLIDDFALNPDQYLKPHHHTEINRIADEYLNS
jgi:hypothetical protein